MPYYSGIMYHLTFVKEYEEEWRKERKNIMWLRIIACMSLREIFESELWSFRADKRIFAK